jgi:5-deoxy-glucuronate isomerase
MIAQWEAAASTDCVLAVCSAPGKNNYGPRLVGPDNINLTKRGKAQIQGTLII